MSMREYYKQNPLALLELLPFVLALIFLAGCTSNSAPDRSDLKSTNIVYFKDDRTNVCYAAMNSLDGHSGWHTTSITYVPCTPEVEKQITVEFAK